MPFTKEQPVWRCIPRNDRNPEAGGAAVREWVKQATPWTIETVQHPRLIARAHDWSGEFSSRYDAETLRANGGLRSAFLAAELPAGYRVAAKQVAA